MLLTDPSQSVQAIALVRSPHLTRGAIRDGDCPAVRIEAQAG